MNQYEGELTDVNRRLSSPGDVPGTQDRDYLFKIFRDKRGKTVMREQTSQIRKTTHRFGKDPNRLSRNENYGQ